MIELLTAATGWPPSHRFPNWVVAFSAPIIAVLLWLVVSRLAILLVGKERRVGTRIFVKRIDPAAFIILFLVFARRSLATVEAPDQIMGALDRLVPLLLIAGSAYLLNRAVGTIFVLVRRSIHIDASDNLKARKATTQILIIERITTFVVAVVAIAVGLMTIPEVRRYGTSLLAGAGVVGLVVGFAAQQTIANVIAGIQIAITQPLRIDDAVVIDGEWGWVEEITLTYIVVRIWDRRRLVTPISYLLQKPFQNWTRTSASILGTVFIHVDYTTDIEALRTEQTRILVASPHWDGEVDVIQVTGAGERSIEIRCLVSAANSSAAWELRCELREKLIRYLQKTQPTALPRDRLRVHGAVITNRRDS